ncbi:hypothetical protein BO78DRAFT_414339 [Aspergillus sclerotiicarbonarius CBS 121057]|uniref:Uncharacterized protein n=1 Tax=Aspergillus sclerotiicarbonarius (strain CBS 121057 / IBT 28362) TaxID=1448318 RepID=A0A319FMJ7_ASPSB|nr:hypothetical protein BO78DRAFT_414339 [Aspergillus sclerotiicarbonarius CBS 121057]
MQAEQWSYAGHSDNEDSNSDRGLCESLLDETTEDGLFEDPDEYIDGLDMGRINIDGINAAPLQPYQAFAVYWIPTREMRTRTGRFLVIAITEPTKTLI